jgi:hypothetical protein
MKDLIKRLLREQSENSVYDIISDVMNNYVHKKIKRYPHSFFMVDGDNVINLELDKNRFLWVSNYLMKQLTKKLSLSSEDTKQELKKWIIKNYK